MPPAQSPETRARQHLLLQGFTLYTAEAACALLLTGSRTLQDPQHAWAMLMDATSWRYTDQLTGVESIEPQLAQHLAAASERCRQQKAEGVLCCTQGVTVFLPMEVAQVRDARMRIEAAIMLGKTPPAEKLEAFPDDLIEREAKRRGLLSRPPSITHDVRPEG